MIAAKKESIHELLTTKGNPLKIQTPIEDVIFAITSANHKYTRRNPIPGNRREAFITESFKDLALPHYVFHVDDIGYTEKFHEYIIKKIFSESNGKVDINPQNTVVVCSTPAVIHMYENAWFQVLPMELDIKTQEITEQTPRSIVDYIAEHWEQKNIREDNIYLTYLTAWCRKVLEKYDLDKMIIKLYNDTTLGNDWDITETRNYREYLRSFYDGAKRKYTTIKPYIKPGNIVDIGCCSWAMIKELSEDRDIKESVLYGVEIARPLLEECIHNKNQWEFKNDQTFFIQRNIAKEHIFENKENFFDTMTTIALTHEIFSYESESQLKNMTQRLYKQLNMGWRWLNLDVVGPKDKDKTILLKLNQEDWTNEREYNCDIKDTDAVENFIESLSTQAKFFRFAADFRQEEKERDWYSVEYKVVEKQWQSYIQTTLEHAAEFMSKHRYSNNWFSEMHERFCFRDFNERKSYMESVGFSIHPDSHAYTNPYFVDNRYKGKIELYEEKDTEILPLEYPETNMLLIAEKK